MLLNELHGIVAFKHLLANEHGHGKDRTKFPRWSHNFWFHSGWKKKNRTKKKYSARERNRRIINTFVGSEEIWIVDAVSKRRSGVESDTLSDWLKDISVILSGLISETEEDKDKGAENSRQAWKLKRNLYGVVTTLTRRRILLDVGEIGMNILPTNVWIKGKASLKGNAADGIWYMNFNAKQGTWVEWIDWG